MKCFFALVLLLSLFSIALGNNPVPDSWIDPDGGFFSWQGDPNDSPTSVYFRLAGSKELVFVMLHGFGASTFSWREWYPRFAKVGTALVYDRPGFGFSSRPFDPGTYAVDPYAPAAQPQILHGLLESLGLAQKQLVLVAHSAGAGVAVDFALAYPTHVRALILIAPSVKDPPRSLLSSVISSPLFPISWSPVQRLLENMLSGVLDQAWYDASRLTPEIREGYEKPTQVEGWEKSLMAFTRSQTPQNRMDKVGALSMPVLLLSGDADQIVPLSQTQELQLAIPGSQLVVVEKCGHLPHEEWPQKSMQSVQSFLELHQVTIEKGW
ncbi:MAG TPA: alpha/beta hydrolase [Thermotogota bacterium]|nr:alpha/beta hydrolase [Thermotogota bacterium]HRW91660.1 alpha/beta hydrolase [Thermotogota bacterium]